MNRILKIVSQIKCRIIVLHSSMKKTLITQTIIMNLQFLSSIMD